MTRFSFKQCFSEFTQTNLHLPVVQIKYEMVWSQENEEAIIMKTFKLNNLENI